MDMVKKGFISIFPGRVAKMFFELWDKESRIWDASAESHLARDSLLTLISEFINKEE